MSTITYTAFDGGKHIGTGDLKKVLTETYEYFHREDSGRGDTPGVLLFRNDTGSQVDFDFNGTLEEVLEKALPPEPKKGPGRPRLGVQCGEVCLMPRHWEWLERQPKKASGTIRRLVEHAMKNMTPEERATERIEATHRFMWAVAGNEVGFEEATRALYAQKWEIFDRLIAPWPEDIVIHLQRMLSEVR